MTSGPQQFKVLFRGNVVWLPPGQLFLGRSCACHIVIDDPQVSRRHAQLTVTTRHVTIEDLNSINGVYVNDERLVGDPRVLREGDRIQIGSEELRFDSGSREAPRRDAAMGATISGADPVVPADADGDGFGFDESESTRRVDALSLLGEAADRAISEGYVGKAEQLLSHYLTEVLSESLAGKSLQQETYETALTHGLKLAWATRNGAWFDYVIELLYARRIPPPTEYAESLYATLHRVGPIDLARLRRYVASLATAIPNPDAKQEEQIYTANLLLQTAVDRQQGQ
jgi:pSer/pThr/pTyr-binding forkhead associated (FHA) protein